jgi:hypothetical protein
MSVVGLSAALIFWPMKSKPYSAMISMCIEVEQRLSSISNVATSSSYGSVSKSWAISRSIITVVIYIVLREPESTTKAPRSCGEDNFVRMYGRPFPLWETELHIRELLVVVESARVSVSGRLRSESLDEQALLGTHLLNADLSSPPWSAPSSDMVYDVDGLEQSVVGGQDQSKTELQMRLCKWPHGAARLR